jgi:uncharacterized protein YwqG
MQPEYDIIRLKPLGKKYMQILPDSYYLNRIKRFRKYFPNATLQEEREKDDQEYDDYLKRDIPIGQSRIGGPIVDLPSDIKYPPNYYFLCQLNCSEIEPFDLLGLLPEQGFLYFFIRHPGNDGVVLYTDKGKECLRRVVKEHLEWAFAGQLIDTPTIEKEAFESRFRMEDGHREWDYFAGDEMTKIYGIYSNCQVEMEDVVDRMNDSNRIQLLQIGSDFMGEGAHCISIEKDDLSKKDFSKCIFEYNQS